MHNLDNPDVLHYLCLETLEAMMVATARKPGTDMQLNVSRAAAADILDVLARHNPGVPKAALKGKSKVVAAVAAATVGLSEEQQRRILAHEKVLGKTMESVVADLGGEHPDELIRVEADKIVEISQGEGLGDLLDESEGRRRLQAIAASVRLEDWAGPVAGPSEIERKFGTRRSTLHEWQKRGAVIGLLRGERKHVFPLAQFVDGRPIEGMSEIVRVIGNPRAAWQWLVQSKPSIGGTPLERLKNGHISQVVEAAERDFG
ncbi:hypothetical protein [Aminobacter sp. J44]|uniref:antitoxin Xre/MbcA/ParS-like domain-containing protein n=1 Tax=Aminobacter sp. J44 TaxID=935262 RepID=UPI001FEE05C8|nr:hypothetical protein [Aminobacter sp. J44]